MTCGALWRKNPDAVGTIARVRAIGEHFESPGTCSSPMGCKLEDRENALATCAKVRMIRTLFRLEGSWIMSKICDVCGKGAMTGNRIIRHGLAKKKGGIGLHTTGVTRRKFMPNLQSVRTVENGTVRKKQVCMSCLKKGGITKA